MIGVIGNEACDADSIVCAIAIALSRIDHIPFVNLNIDDIDCRLDFRAICKIVNITDPVKQFKIHSIDEIETMDDTIEGWILVDHNDSFFTKIISPIIEVIDHHAIVSESATIRLESIPHVIESVGSCATLVARNIMVENPNFITTDLGKIILKMLLLTIVLDTQNFSKSVGKATPEDLRVVDLICNHLGEEIVDDVPQLMSKWFSEMSRAKFDPTFWYKAGNEEKILRYDFKRYELGNGGSIGMSVILRNIDDSIEQTAALALRRNSHKLYVVSGAYFVDNRQMVQILVIGHLPQSAIDHLISTFSLELIRSDSDRLLFQVNDPTFSRKKFAPVLLALCDDS